MSLATEFPPIVAVPTGRNRSGALSYTEPGPERWPVPAGRRHLRAVATPARATESVIPSANATSRATPWRLTGRGRLALWLTLAASAFAIVLLAQVSAPTGQSAPPANATVAHAATVVVQPGDTLWSIAGEVAPNIDTRLTVSRLRGLNGLTDVALEPGQTLRLR